MDAYEVDHDKMLEAFRAIPAWVLAAFCGMVEKACEPKLQLKEMWHI